MLTACEGKLEVAVKKQEQAEYERQLAESQLAEAAAAGRNEAERLARELAQERERGPSRELEQKIKGLRLQLSGKNRLLEQLKASIKDLENRLLEAMQASAPPRPAPRAPAPLCLRPPLRFPL